MFDLAQAIAQWRRRLAAAGLNAPAALDELEIHLRDDFERRRDSGQGESEAFALAVEQLGPAGPLQEEFSKIHPHPTMNAFLELVASTINPTRPVRPLVKILLGFAIVAFGVAIILPALAQSKMDGASAEAIALGVMFGTIVATSGAWVLLQSIIVRAPKASE